MVARQIFNALSLRERYLLAIFVWTLLFLWLVFLVQALQTSVRTLNLNRAALESFEYTLSQTSQAEALLRSAREGLDSSKTFSASQLVGRLDSLARANEVSSFDISTPTTLESQLFTFNNVRLSIKRARITELIRFKQAVKVYSPYIALGDFQVSANKRDPRFLDATFELVSFELKEEALNE
ncbi:MAG: hypothetical protein ACO3ZW_06955 [Opitutales bacterium]|jgi:hypothetical protein